MSKDNEKTETENAINRKLDALKDAVTMLLILAECHDKGSSFMRMFDKLDTNLEKAWKEEKDALDD